MPLLRPALCLALLLPLAGHARQANETRLDADARSIIEVATHGQAPAAIARAQELRVTTDTQLGEHLDELGKNLATRTDASTGVFLADESHFGACVHRTYGVRRANGTERWRFSWRDGSSGWRLSELAVLD